MSPNSQPATTDLGAAFYHMAESASAERPLVPEAAEAQVRGLIEVFEAEVGRPFAPHGGAHGLVFGEWGHGKTQVLYRLAAHLGRQTDRCLILVIIPEQMSPYHLVTAAAHHAEREGLPTSPLREVARKLDTIDPRDASASQLAAAAFVDYAAASGRPHAALLFDEAQTIQGVSFQHFLKEIRQAFRDRSLVLHTLQCHSLVSLDRAVELAQDLEWLQGSAVRKVHLPSLREEQAHELFRSRLAPVAADLADRFIAPGLARTICRLVGGNPRSMLTLAQELAREVGSGRVATGDDLVRVCERQAGEAAGSSLFMRRQLQRLTELLPQVWQAPLGTMMSQELGRNIGRWFGEDVALEVSTVADRLGVDVPVLERNLRRRVDGIQLFEMKDDALGATTLQLSFECRRYLSRSFAHGGDFNEKQAQFDCLMAPTLQQRALADALRLTELGEMSQPLRLGTYTDEAQIRGYELRYQVPETSYTGTVLLAPMLGLHWPTEVARAAVERLQGGACARVIIFDLIVNRAWQDWDAACKGAGFILPVDPGQPNVVRIDADAWAPVLPAPRDAADQLGARVAVLCAALLGAEHARQNHVPMTDDQKSARGGIMECVRDLLPGADDFCYLPTPDEQQWLDLPQWSSGPLTLAALRDALERPQLTVVQLRDLVPHWLEDAGTRKWKRRPWVTTLLAQAVVKALKGARAPLGRDQLADRLRGRLALAHWERLDNSLMWLLNKLAAEGLIDIDMLGAVRFRDLTIEIREKRTMLQRSRNELDRTLSQLERLSHDKWSSVREQTQTALQAAVTAATASNAGGPALSRRLDDALEKLRQALVVVTRQVAEADQALARLAADITEWVADRRREIGLVHSAWRKVLGLDAALTELERFESSVTRLTQTGDVGTDRLGHAVIGYQRARVWNDRLRELLRDGGAREGARRTVAKAVLSGGFREIAVTFRHTSS
jgi:hypothetical protein